MTQTVKCYSAGGKVDYVEIEIPEVPEEPAEPVDVEAQLMEAVLDHEIRLSSLELGL